ncbi:MAG: hypothetical protein LBP58_05680 [Azoarcus sp.]|jgi:hypothetical protein|nr:hypothetical protein [Azoarcus sp.]
MPQANLKLDVTFEFEIAAPEALLSGDHASLCRKLSELLGTLVLQGMPKVTATQLAKAGAHLVGHHYHLDAKNLSASRVDRALLAAAAPHLTDAELDDLAHRASGKMPEDAAALQRYLRRQALALVNEYRLVPCQVEGKLKSSGTITAITLDATLNLTNGSVMIDEAGRQNRLQQGAGAVTVIAADGTVRLGGNCEGHTLSGPVIGVSIADIASARDALIRLWQAGQQP